MFLLLIPFWPLLLLAPPRRLLPNEDGIALLGTIFCLGNVESFDKVVNEAGMGTGIGSILLFSGCRLFCPLLNDVPAEFKADGNAENVKEERSYFFNKL